MTKKYLVQHALGAFLLDPQGNVERYELNTKDVDEAAEQALVMEGWVRGMREGEEKRAGLAAPARKLLENLKNENFEGVLVFETDSESREAAKLGFEVAVEPANEPARALRSQVASLAVKYGFVDSEKEFYEWLRRVDIEVVRRKLRSVAQKRDLLAAQAVRSIDDIDKVVNLMVARLREWYSLHFPELDKLVKDHEAFVKIVAELGGRDNITKEKLLELGFSEALAEKIAEAAKKSTGADLTETDIEQLQKLASIIMSLYNLRRDLVDYISYIMKEVAPNVTALVGPVLGARLISLAGSLENLAKMPASTIQVLGAEKALFRALRTGGKPPQARRDLPVPGHT